jgi:hypothetical protein
MGIKKKDLPEYSFNWEDSEVAKVSTLICSCGHNMTDQVPSSSTVQHGDTVLCLSCNKKWKFCWHGMELHELE